VAAVASRGLCQAQTAAAAVPEPQNRYFTRFSRSPPASSGCGQLIRHKSACGRSGDQGSQGEPPRSLGGLYAAVGAPAQSYRGSTIIPWPLPPPLALSTIFRRFSADVAVLPAASPFRGAAAPAFPLILRRAPTTCGFECRRRFAPARSRDRQGAPGYPRLCVDDETCGVGGLTVCVREGGVLSRQPQARYGWVMMT
jgi:hypothetical protein